MPPSARAPELVAGPQPNDAFQLPAVNSSTAVRAVSRTHRGRCCVVDRQLNAKPLDGCGYAASTAIRSVAMYELHETEQYFFDSRTLLHLTDFLSVWENPCCICAPLLGQAVAEAGFDVRILDIDERFSSVRGFRRFDLHRPKWLGERFGIILCDPPFYSVSLSRLFEALRLVSQHDYQQPLMVSCLTRRSSAITGTFRPFGLAASGYKPGYQTVQRVERNDIEFFTNLDASAVRKLTAAQHV